jgi:hypothetical protein
MSAYKTKAFQTFITQYDVNKKRGGRNKADLLSFLLLKMRLNWSLAKPHESTKLTFEEMKINGSKHTIYYMLDSFFPKNNWQVSNFYTVIYSSLTFYASGVTTWNYFWPRIIFTSIHIILKKHCMTHVVVCLSFSAGATYVNRCGFQWFLYGQNPNQNTVVK